MRHLLAALFLALSVAPVRADAPAGEPAPSDALLIGTYTLREAPDGVVDGDTFRVDGRKRSLRLLFIDTEEKARHGYPGERMLALMKRDFGKYARQQRGDSALPVKFATPMGEEATAWAARFLGPRAKLRLERDDPSSGADQYGRELCLVWVMRDEGPPQLYNLECVRAGMSPYYDKYGRSRRFHEAFLAAQAEAREAGRGIWDPAKEHYPDYPERVAWWSQRGEALQRYDKLKAAGRAPLMLGNRKSIDVLLAKVDAGVGQTVSVFGVVDDHDQDAVTIREDGATLKVGGGSAIEVELVGKDVVAAVKPRTLFGHYIAVRGPLDQKGSEFKIRRKTYKRLRVVVTDAAQLTPGHLLKVD